jgi:hypothetical protein
MALNNGKHVVAEIEGTRCTVVETGLNENRAGFLRNLLVHNGFEVKTEMEKTKEGSPLETRILGVTDILFNPVISVYERKLVRNDGQVVNPAYWNQWQEDPDLPYYLLTR